MLAERRVRASIGKEQPVEHLEQRRLPTTVGAEQREALATRDRQRDAVERGETAEVGVGDATDREQRFSSNAPGVTTRQHRLVYLLRERVRLAEQRATRRGDERASPRGVRIAADRARLARGVHVGDAVEEVEHVAVGHPENQHEHAGHEERPQRREQPAPPGGERQQDDQ